MDVIFTRGGTGGQGSVSGTFSFDLIGADHKPRAAEVIASLAWTSDRNTHGVQGSQIVNGSTKWSARRCRERTRWFEPMGGA